MGFQSNHRSPARRSTFMFASALGLAVAVCLNSAPALAAAPVLSEDPAVTECAQGKCQPPEYSSSSHVWYCPGAEAGQACNRGEKCSITLANKGDAGAVQTTDPDKPFIKCTCRPKGQGDGPVTLQPLESNVIEAVTY